MQLHRNSTTQILRRATPTPDEIMDPAMKLLNRPLRWPGTAPYIKQLGDHNGGHKEAALIHGHGLLCCQRQPGHELLVGSSHVYSASGVLPTCNPK
jgi:hypothetical protein